MRSRSRNALVAMAAASVLAAVAGCGSSSGGTAGGASGGPAKSIVIGLLTDQTGPAASAARTSVDGMKAGVQYAARNGYNIRYVVGDTATNPTTALTAAQKMVTRDHVTAVIALSALTFTTSAYFTQHNVPVLGNGQDGPEWITAPNMFSVVGALNTTKVATTVGTFFKAQGVTSLGALGYAISPTSAETAKAAGESAKKAGIKVGYVNAAIPFGTTDIGPVALAMKSAGVDGLALQIDPNTSFALITALRDQGVDIKAALLPTGYGGDLLGAGPGALNDAQGAFFGLQFEPIEMQTAATKQFAADLKAGGVSGAPTYAMYSSYVSVGLLVQALKATGGATAPAGLIKALSSIHDFTALGLFGDHKLDINDRKSSVGGVDNCLWVTKLEGKVFTPVKNASPVCGSVIDGVTVSASS
ncbi:ABC transporter substrate-binding protein [Pseudofrankia sp. DC12]|uniref:ABC transporter substrate-binding protein n=1 Tax=Pseudofrankia sp. DC12 TaxID=683315 RepID=UPI0005F83675|nr:ABC transporter substrate-binding protein [Pseudofrankia sp. DC12]